MNERVRPVFWRVPINERKVPREKLFQFHSFYQRTQMKSCGIKPNIIYDRLKINYQFHVTAS